MWRVLLKCRGALIICYYKSKEKNKGLLSLKYSLYIEGLGKFSGTWCQSMLGFLFFWLLIYKDFVWNDNPLMSLI